MKNKILEKLLSHFISLTSDEVENYVQSNSSDDCTDCSIIEILNIFDPELELLNTKPMIKNKLKEFLCEMNKFKV